MALGLSIIYSIEDRKGEISTTEVNLPVSVNLVDATTFASDLAPLISPLITGRIRRIGIVASVTIPAGAIKLPAPDSDVEEGALFGWETDTGYFTTNRLATFNENFLIEGTTEVDRADPAVAAFITAMQSGINGVAPSDSRGEDIQRVNYAVEDFQGSRRKRR